MNKRDIEDVIMQGRDTANTILEESNKEMNETIIKRAFGELWANIPEEYKARMAIDKPDVVAKMNEMYGGGKAETAQGNPWGGSIIGEKKGR
jgi:hypothetical protein